MKQNFLPPTVVECHGCIAVTSVLSVQLSIDQKPLGVYRNECVFVGMKLFRGNMNIRKVVVTKFQVEQNQESSRIIIA